MRPGIQSSGAMPRPWPLPSHADQEAESQLAGKGNEGHDVENDETEEYGLAGISQLFFYWHVDLGTAFVPVAAVARVCDLKSDKTGGKTGWENMGAGARWA
jgi:hypothetical protein